MTVPKMLPKDEVHITRARRAGPAWTRKVIYTVTALRVDLRNGRITRSRVWCWYPTKELAFKSGFIGDDEAGYYDTWLVETVTAGFPYCRREDRWWFKKLRGKVVQIPDPPCFSHICNFSIG